MAGSKHVVVALLVAPVLSILAWMAVGQFTGEQPAPAQPGLTYPLLEKSNCRYASGLCDMENADFQIRLRLVEASGQKSLDLQSSHVLEGAIAAIGMPEIESSPRRMVSLNDDGLAWTLPLSVTPDGDQRIYIAVGRGQFSYHGDAATTFLQHED